MPGPLEGVRVVEVASFVFVPAAAAILADWGAEVIKVERPEWGDPVRQVAATCVHDVRVLQHLAQGGQGGLVTLVGPRQECPKPVGVRRDRGRRLRHARRAGRAG